jgi:hypothetical protein
MDPEQISGKVWYEEEIVPAEATIEGMARALKDLDGAELALALGDDHLSDLTRGERAQVAEAFARREVRGLVAINEPLAVRAPAGFGAGFARGTPYLVKLGVEYRLNEAMHKAKARYKKVWCRAALLADSGRCRPRVLDVYPVRFYESEPKVVRVEISPSLKLAAVEASLGGVAFDVQVGVVAPATLAYYADPREPHWEMTEQKHEIRGHYDFWLLLDLPDGCDPDTVRLSVLGEGDLRMHLASVPMGPKVRGWEERAAIALGAVLGRG